MQRGLGESRVLLIDDEREHLELLSRFLRSRFLVFTADHGRTGIELAQSKRPDIILLDIRMPELDGISACEHLRSDPVTRDIPIIIVSGSDCPNERTSAYLAGADDFLTKPFKSSELIARIDSKLRRFHELRPQNPVLGCGNLVLDPQNVKMTISGRPVAVTMLEFDLLQCFLRSPSRLISRDHILKEVWRGSAVSARSIDTHIANLRKKLTGFDHEFISVYGSGYRLRKTAD